jgi:hypothetical protein
VSDPSIPLIQVLNANFLNNHHKKCEFQRKLIQIEEKKKTQEKFQRFRFHDWDDPEAFNRTKLEMKKILTRVRNPISIFCYFLVRFIQHNIEFKLPHKCRYVTTFFLLRKKKFWSLYESLEIAENIRFFSHRNKHPISSYLITLFSISLHNHHHHVCVLVSILKLSLNLNIHILFRWKCFYQKLTEVYH